MKQSVSVIVQELIELDSSLASRRKELTKLVQELLDAQIDASPDAQFTRELLRTLRERLGESGETAPHFSFFPFSFMDSKFIFAGGGAVVGALLVFVVMQQPLVQSPVSVPTLTRDHDGQMKISETAPEGFGALTDENAGVGVANPRPQSGGGGGGYGGGGGMAMDSMMYPPEDYYQLRFAYEGALSLPTENVEVLRRVKPEKGPSGAGVVSGAMGDMIDWSSFGGLQLQNVSLVQGGSDPYSFYIDYLDGSMSINRNMNYAAHPEYQCQDQDCFDRYRLKEKDMLADEEAIRLARQFVEKAGIDLSSYGEPVMQDEWRMWYARAEDKLNYYFPEQVSVMFPLVINGKPVYEEYGSPAGLSVNVDVRNKQVVGAYNLYLQQYQKSDYAPANDEARIREVINFGSTYMWQDPNAKIATAKLGSPTEGYVRMYKWDQKTGISSDLYVPALVFPVTEMPEQSFDTRKNVIVPLAAELLQQPDAVYPQPMPLTEPAVDPAVMEAEAVPPATPPSR